MIKKARESAGHLSAKASWGMSYGELVWGEFIKSRLSAASLIFVVFLFSLAIFAPFLANDKPFVIRVDGQLHFPLFRNLRPNDYCVFLAAIVGLVQLLLIRRNRRRIDPSVRGAVLWRQICISSSVILIGGILAFVFVPRRLDATDYKGLAATGKATDAIFGTKVA